MKGGLTRLVGGIRERAGSSQWRVFAALVLIFWAVGYWQVRANRQPATDEEVEEVSERSECARADIADLKPRERAALSMSKLLQIEANCTLIESLKSRESGKR